MKHFLDPTTRSSALDSLRLYLSRSTPFASLELLKLWKGLFYCMWLTSNPVPQQQLSEDIASFIFRFHNPHRDSHVRKQRRRNDVAAGARQRGPMGSRGILADANVLPFLSAFWTTLAREWSQIDYLRMDKYLRLARLILRAGLARVALREKTEAGLEGILWDSAQAKEHSALLATIPFNVQDSKIPDGMRMHTLDIYIDEVETVQRGITGAYPNEQKKDQLPGSVLHTMLEPVKTLRQRTQTRTVRMRCDECLQDERVLRWQTGSRSNDYGQYEDDENEEE